MTPRPEPRSAVSTSNMLRNFFLGFIKVHILHHAAEEPLYGVALIGELRRHGYELSPGTLYPILHALENAGYLTRENRVVDGRVRKYYTITPRGKRALAAARTKVVELVREISGEAGTGQPAKNT